MSSISRWLAWFEAIVCDVQMYKGKNEKRRCKARPPQKIKEDKKDEMERHGSLYILVVQLSMAKAFALAIAYTNRMRSATVQNGMMPKHPKQIQIQMERKYIRRDEMTVLFCFLHHYFCKYCYCHWCHPSINFSKPDMNVIGHCLCIYNLSEQKTPRHPGLQSISWPKNSGNDTQALPHTKMITHKM